MIDKALPDSCDLAVIGAGPSGMAAAATAAALGLSTVLLDEQPAPGGQIYRGITETAAATRAALGADYRRGEALVEALVASKTKYSPGSSVFDVSPSGEIAFLAGGRTHLLAAKRILAATGGQERPFPIEGWTLPGVMTAGAAQTLLKQADLVPSGRVVLAGSGPLLWLLAAQILRAGGTISTILDTTPKANWRAALPHLPRFLASPYAAKGLALLARVRLSVKVVSGVTFLRASGGERLREVTYRCGSAEVTVAADALLLHQGVVPSLHMPDTLGCRILWNGEQRAFQPEADEWGATSVAHAAIAGDGAGIGGARSAARRGRLAAWDAAHRLGRIDRAERDRLASDDLAALQRDLAARRFLDVLYEPAAAFRAPTGDTIVCRCEEVRASKIEAAIAQGILGPNQLKFFMRCGMGPCQGRLCGLSVTEMFAQARGVSPAEIGHYRLRTPIKPVTVAEMASLPFGEHADKAVVRL
ncbi:NAD(P)/FAD-dependent oxidoreductase [uncultured Bosea sp.]|uniref:FAD/NAD(P)-dependent oxidoreductase n=1 Tax=uncultured Bosea sp. TaxID=211457 RepID=UPI0025CF7929|nr:NAD(P)/FAD-dependent oxidoreductase [uncultured Bosea sp.]